MKWFKHMTASWDDEKMAALVGEGGDSGLALYGAYWRIAEIVAAQMEGKAPSCSVSYPVWRWARMLSVRKSYLTSILLRLQKEGLLVIEHESNSDQNVIVQMPNLLKYRDEYARKSGHAQENVPPRTEGDTDTDKRQEKKPAPKASPSAFGIPDWLPMDAWQAFVEMRKKERHPLSEGAVKLAISKLEKLRASGQDIQAVLEESTLRGYRGLFPVNGNGTNGSRHPPPSPASEEYERKVKEMMAERKVRK